jgi:hypothetical protein
MQRTRRTRRTQRTGRNESLMAADRPVRHRKSRRVVGKLAASIAASMAIILLVVSISNPAAADEYDSKNAGHPLKIVAYMLHPVGVIIDYLLLRPAHWLGSHEPFKTAFGHED